MGAGELGLALGGQTDIGVGQDFKAVSLCLRQRAFGEDVVAALVFGPVTK